MSNHTNEPIVSVVIPTYNRAGLIRHALDSVLNQTYQNIEIIVVDDGSTDNSYEILKTYGNKIQYIKTDHAGTAYARNVGMNAASGEYIGFLDSDDYYHPFKIELQTDFLKAHPEVGMVYTEFSRLDEMGIIDELFLQEYHANYRKHGWSYDAIFPDKGYLNCTGIKYPIAYYVGNIFKYCLLGTFVVTNTMLLRKSILNIVGLQKENIQFGQEYEFSVRIAKHYLVGFLNTSTYVLRFHSGQATRFLTNGGKSNREDIKQELKVWKLFHDVVMKHGVRDLEYYNQNKESIDNRIVEIYCEMGDLYLQYGDVRAGRSCFRNCDSFGGIPRKYRKHLLLAYTSNTISRNLLKIVSVSVVFLKKLRKTIKHIK